MPSFSDLCAFQGRKELDIDRLSDVEKSEVQSCINVFTALNKQHASTRNPEFEIQIGFLQENSVNARAIHWEGSDFIAINIGALRELRSLANSILDTDVIDWVHDDQARADTGAWLYECAKRALFLHEMGHVWHGHTAWMVDKETPYLAEAEAFPITEEESLDRRTLEFDADTFSYTTILLTALSEKPPVIDEEREAEARGATGIFLMAIAIYMSRRVFYRADEEMIEENGTHPSHRLRQAYFMDTIGTILLSEEPIRQKALVKAFVDGVKASERAASAIRGVPEDRTFFENFTNGVYWKKTRVLLKNWHNLYPRLNELKRGGVLPLPQEGLDG